MYYLAPICRVCIKNDSVLINIHNLDNDKISFYGKLKLCFSEIVFENTSMQTYICQNCCSNLKKVYDFRELCSSSQSVLKQYVAQLESENTVKDKSQNKLNELIDMNYEHLNSTIKSIPKVQICSSEINMNIIETENSDFECVDNEWLEPTCVVNIKNEEIKLDDIDLQYQDSIAEDQNEQNINDNVYTDYSIMSSNISKTSPSKRLIGHQLIDNSEKRYKCDVCSKGFNKSSHLRVHERIHTGEKPHECDICGKSFNRLDHLQKHRRIHTGEKPHACNICSKSFNRLDHLQKHKRIHTGENPFVCDVCNKSFNQSGNLHLHKRIHTGEKPYECDVCRKSFNQSCSLSTHKRIHISDKQ